MKRAIPQKVRPVSSTVANSDVVPGQSKQSLPEVNRRAGTSAAVIGLAISVGAHCLLLPRQGDNAVAAEPTPGEAATNVAVLSPDALAPASVSAATMREHIVQEGQSLWQIADAYHADAASIAALNRLPLDVVLRVGQVLQIPTDTRVASLSNDAVINDSASYYGLIQSDTVAARSASASNAVEQKQLAASREKEKQDKAVSNLKQVRENLKVSLNRLESGNVKPAQTIDVVGTSIVPTTSDVSQVPQLQIEETIKPAVYQVAPGDTLSEIARIYGVSQEALIKANRIANPNFLLVGQSLKVDSVSKTSSQSKLNSSSKGISVAQEIGVRRSDAAQPLTSVLPKATPTTANKAAEFQPEVASLPSSVARSEAIGVAESNPAGTLNNLATGDAQIASAPFAVSPASGGVGSTNVRYSYIDNLRNEIIQMREKYRTSVASVPNSGTKVAAASLGLASLQNSSDNRVNPEFKSVAAKEALPSRLQAVQSQLRTTSEGNGLSTTATLQRSNSQVVAVAPLGSQTYEPLLPSSLGQVVSPDLPSIGPSETYLPRTPGRFAGYIWPAKGMLSSGYGWRWGRMHRGIDIAGPIGTPIVAAASGVVITAGWNSGGYGNMVDIQHADGSVTRYAHNNRILVRPGQTVDQGQQIAEMGSTGFSTGPHSHFEVHLPGQGAVNPMAYLPRSGA